VEMLSMTPALASSSLNSSIWTEGKKCPLLELNLWQML
jgi:hypothetical protein